VTGKIWVCDDEPSERFPVFTRGNVGEVFVEAVSPLTWTALGRLAWEPGWRDAFCAIGAFTPDEFKAPGQPEITACFGGYIYINMSVTRVLAVRIPGMSVEAIDRSLFGDAADAPPYRPDPRDADPARTEAVTGWLQSLFTVDPRPTADRYRDEALAQRARRPDFATLSDAGLADYFRSLIPQARRLFEQHVRNTYGANVLTSVVAQLAEAAGEARLAANVTAAVGDVDSAAHSFELWTLSRKIRSSPALSALFDAGVDGLTARLSAADDAETRAFASDWRLFLDRWGFLGPSVWDLRSPTFATDPALPLRMLERARHSADSADPELRFAALAFRRDAAVAELSARLSAMPDLQARFAAAARSAGNYLSARERGKTTCTLWNEEARSVMRELGGRQSRRGILPRWQDILLLQLDELDAFLAAPPSFAGIIDERRRTLALLESREPPFVFEGPPPPLSAFADRRERLATPEVAGQVLRGIGVSPGVHTGRARVITSLDVDSELEPGEVIVTEVTDASWGPLMLSAGAVVVETGAPISHAAIVSRELGIPAVVSVADATHRIANGCLVTVDGNTGTVTLE
jgi:phosphohistidine swiveling domain-containing protein